MAIWLGETWKLKTLKTVGTRRKINAILLNIKVNPPKSVIMCQYELTTCWQNFTVIYLTWVKISQNVLGGLLFWLTLYIGDTQVYRWCRPTDVICFQRDTSAANCPISLKIFACKCTVWWRGGAIGRASDLRFIGRGFKSCLDTIAQWPWASYLHLCASVTKQYNLVLVKGR